MLRYPSGVNEKLSRLYREQLALSGHDGSKPAAYELAARLGKAGREDVAARFAPRQIAEQLAVFAQDVVDGFGKP